MSTTGSRSGGADEAPELAEVTLAAEAALEARASGDDADAAGRRLTTAAKAALDAGYGLAVVAEAEASGQTVARDRIRKELLRRIERSAKRQREVTAEHEALVAQADALGLGAREIAERAGVAHGTIAAIVRRHGARTSDPIAERSGTTEEDLSPATAAGSESARSDADRETEEVQPAGAGA